MNNRFIVWKPKFSLTPSIAKHLMQVEAARTAVELIQVPVDIAAELRKRARIRSTHYSTRIEGNRLTLGEAEDIIEKRRVTFHGRERDVREVQNYWNALLQVEEWAAKKTPLTEDLLRRLHAMVMKGKRAKPTVYRDGQNVIRDADSGAIIYLPPEAKDVPLLMKALISWINKASKDEMPPPIIGALAHYQFVTIHPYYDGNGRTARLLATFILHREGYSLKGFFSLEEHHAIDLDGYYRSLATHPHHNYYEGRAEADLTGWLEYFTSILARVFLTVRGEAESHTRKDRPFEPEELRHFDRRARIVLSLFAKTGSITSGEVAKALGLSDRMARTLLKTWVKDGWLVITGASNKSRRYILSEIYRKFIGNVSTGTPPGTFMTL